MGEWPTVALSDVADLTVGHVGPMATEYVDSGVTFLRSQNVLPMRLDLSDVKYVSRPFHERLAKSALHPGDVVIVRTGRPGACTVIPNDLAEANCSDLVVIRCGSQLEPRFLSYYVNAIAGAAHVDAYTVGAVQQHFNVGAAKVMRVPLPPLGVQRRITGILGALDDKIELNRRMSETLEATARALFKSWFVDFDPVLASGQEALCLGDLLTLERGLSYKGEFLGPSGVPLVNLGCFLGHGRFAESAMKHYAGAYQDRHLVSPGDLLIANTDLTQKRDVLGSPALVPWRQGNERMLFSHHLYAARFREGREPWTLFVYFSLMQEAFRERAIGFATGTTVLALPRDAILGLQVTAPPRALVDSFDDAVRPMMERQQKAKEASAALVAVRNALLPKLISGELRQSDADQLVDAVSA